MSAHTFLGSPLNVADQGAYENTFLHTSQLNWEPVQGEKGATGLTAMPKGLLRAVLFGDPNLPGLCMFRMKYPPNYRVPPHFHGMAEHTSVLEGEAYFGLGDTFDEFEVDQMERGRLFHGVRGNPALCPDQRQLAGIRTARHGTVADDLREPGRPSAQVGFRV